MVKIIVSGMCARFTSLRSFSTKTKAVLDDTVAATFSNNEIKYRLHPGVIKPRTPIFPTWASKEIKDILKEKHIVAKDINESAKKLARHLHGRYAPLEQSDITMKLQKVEEHLNAKYNKKVSIGDIDFKKNAEARKLLKQNTYNWQPINFDTLTSLTYLVARSVQNYAVSSKIFNEIKVRDENFKPKSLFDFGSGIGTVMWAASEMWSDSLKEYFCVEISESMMKLSERLAKVAEPKIKEIFYRQYFPTSINPKYDIVISAYTLFELPSMQSRLETLLQLWRKTENYLIIVEEGTNAGFRLVNEARDFILRYANSRNRHSTQFAHVFSPCPHDLTCPRFTTDDTPCNFKVLCYPLLPRNGWEHKPELYSYVVLKKCKRSEDDEQWPRIVRNVLKRSNHTICRMCNAKGELKEDIFTEYKNGKHMYRCARSSEWGDRLPLYYEQQERDEVEEDEIVDDTTNTVGCENKKNE